MVLVEWVLIIIKEIKKEKVGGKNEKEIISISDFYTINWDDSYTNRMWRKTTK